MTLKVKRVLEDAVLPSKAHEDDTGYDLVAATEPKPVYYKYNSIDELLTLFSGYEVETLRGFSDEVVLFVEYDTGIVVDPPEGYHTEVFPRSSITKTGLILANSVGLIDPNYRDSIKLRFAFPFPARLEALISQMDKVDHNNQGLFKEKNNIYQKGDRIGQLVLRKTESMDVEEVNEVSSTERGMGGFGSTGG